MDDTAINRISELAIEATRANRLDSHTPAVLVGERIISLEHLQEQRSRFRGKFETSVLSEFAGYLKAHQGGEGYIDAKACTAKVYLNLGSKDAPGHGDWTAALKLDATAAYATLLKIDGAPLDQKTLVEWIEDWFPNLSSDDGLAKSIAAIRSFTIAQSKNTTHTDKDFGASRSTLEDVEAKSSHGLPSHLTFTTIPYLGFKSRTFTLRLAVHPNDKPTLSLRMVSREQVIEDIAQEFKASLLECVGDAATMTIGNFTP